MQCPSCKETIDDDSRYCDQCGEQIMVCSMCGRAGKGKRCIFDGKELVPATGNVSAPAVQTQAVQHVPQSGGKIKLTSQMHGIMIEAQDGDIIGSKKGTFASVFKRFNHVSGEHCRIVKTLTGWHIKDTGSTGEGSTNGTFFNGSRLTPNTLYPLASGITVTIADVELLVTYDTSGGGTVRI
jgi:hypothetical protein